VRDAICISHFSSRSQFSTQAE